MNARRFLQLVPPAPALALMAPELVGCTDEATPDLGRSIVVYRGPSALNGAPIVAILTGLSRRSKNAKTGDMLQLWIMHADVAPHDAQATGDDAAACGNCPMRPALASTRPEGLRQCYVRTFQAPLATWRANRDKRANLSAACAAVRRRNVPVRLGAYGDPAALPRHVIASLAAASGYRLTGYSHQWRTPSHAWLRDYVMASVESAEGAAQAWAEGWRTFRVGSKAEGSVSGVEIDCPSERGVKCSDCGLCNGARGSADRRKSIYIETH